MPIRIYAFAKEIGLDNKALLDVCEKLGIRGKGSALASLDDDEIARIKEHLSAKPEAAPVAVVETVRPEVAPPVREAVVQRRPGPIMRDLDSKPRRPLDGHRDAKKDAKEKEPARKSPVVKLAAMPEVEQPSTTPVQPEIKVQKPDIALPQDAIRKAKSGAAPLSQFTQSTKDKRSVGATPPKHKAGAGGAAAFTPMTTEEQASRRKEKDKERDKRRRGEDGVDANLSSIRQRRSRRDSASDDRDAFDRPLRRRKHVGVSPTITAPRKERVVLTLPCSVRSFSEATGLSGGTVVKNLMELGVMANINAALDPEMARLLADQHGLEIDFRQTESALERILARFSTEDEPDQLQPRPPVVTFLGHVDHGKTSLLDAIIGINVVSGEAGGITQHIRAYDITTKNHQKISFVDTPGHAAFTEMRARGANVTDIAVLVIAADDGIMPQTEEAISHAKAAKVPIIVALNKIDLPSANVDKCYQDLAANELLPSEWGGDIEVVKTSATQRTGIDELLETILLTAELHEYRANPDRPASGTCLEAEQEPGRGVIAKFLVQTGTLRVGDVVVCGPAHGRVKAMFNTLRASKKLKEAPPSTPVNITGLDIPPAAGDKFYVLQDIAEARDVAQLRDTELRRASLSGITTRVSLDEFQQRLEAGTLGTADEVVELNLILRADVRGSIEAILKELERLQHPEIRINLLQALVGGITTADVRLAQASNAVILGFNVVPDDQARALADEVQVEIRRYDVIYKITDDIKATLEGRLKPDQQVVELGMAMVLRTFTISKVGTIAGCRVMRGSIHRDARCRIIRDSRVIGDYPLDSLKREKDDAKEVQRGMECGIKLAGFNDVKEGDQLEAYKIEEVARKL